MGNEAVILTEAPSGRDCNCKQGREMRSLAHKRNPFLLQEKSFPLLRKKSSLFSREIDFSQRGNLKSKGRSEANAGHNLFCKTQFSATDLIKLSSSMQKML